jgi:hypothetical protein
LNSTVANSNEGCLLVSQRGAQQKRISVEQLTQRGILTPAEAFAAAA